MHVTSDHKIRREWLLAILSLSITSEYHIIQRWPIEVFLRKEFVYGKIN